MPLNLKDWQCPPHKASEDRKLGWLAEGCEEGQNTIRNQRGFGDWRKAMDVLAGRNDSPEALNYRSRIATNRLKRNVREVVGALSNIRPIWGYSSDNPSFSGYATMFNKVSRALYLENSYDRSLKEALQYAAATCTGWIRPVYRRAQGGRGKGNIQLLTYGAPCVLPVQLPSSNEWQEAYAVHLMDEMPVYMAHSMWPEFQDRLNPTASKYWYSMDIRRSAQTNLWNRIFSRNQGVTESSTNLFVPIRYTTIIDNSVNLSGEMLAMGQPGSPWYYQVPSRGMMIPDGYNQRGERVFREATVEDARKYPYRRQIISSQNCILYDGPAFNWHGELDLIPFCLDGWPWEAIGYSAVRDGYELQEAINELTRGSMDKCRAQLDLPLGYDINAVTRKQAEEFDPIQPRGRIGFDGSFGDKPFMPVVPPEVYEIGKEVPMLVKYLEETMDYQMAIRDIVALAKAKAIGKDSDQLEALMEAQGPIVKDMSRSMEQPLARLGQQLKFLILQYLPPARVMQYIGADGITMEVFDFNPGSIVPSHLPDESPTHPVTGAVVPSRYGESERARWFAENLRFLITPHTVHEMVQTQYKLMLLQMRQRDIPIDSRTIAEACDVPNFGTKPEGDTVYERFQNEQEDKLMNQIRAALVAREYGLENGLDPAALNGGGGGPGGGGSGVGKKGGRPPTAQQAPQLKQKSDGRPTISESG